MSLTIVQYSWLLTDTETVNQTIVVPLPGEAFPIEDTRFRVEFRVGAADSEIAVVFDSDPFRAQRGAISIDEQDAELQAVVLNFSAPSKALFNRPNTYIGDLMMLRALRASRVGQITMQVDKGFTRSLEEAL